VKSLSDLREDDDDVSASQQEQDLLIVGTVFKQQERRPSILKELSEDGGLEVEPAHTKYTADTDTLVLEDDTMRVRLEDPEDKMRPRDLVNGVVAGVWGREAQGGKFRVSQAVYAGAAGGEAAGEVPEEELSLCLLSGLQLGGEGGAWLGAAQLAVDWLAGSAGGPGEQGELAGIERVVIAGDSLSGATRDRDQQTKAKYLTVGTAAGSIAAVRQLDDLLVQLASSLPTDLMPGPSDPATCVLPQQPLHRLMFPQAGRLPTLQSVTNPYSLTTCGRRVIVTSGQAVADILRNSELAGPLEAMERCLAWGHLAPTTPDTLGLFPYAGSDPHVLDHLPDIFVVGNQPGFLSRTVQVGLAVTL
jgi:DNA polymerase delta subunit 2